MRFTTNINGINGVGPGQTATVLFPVDRRYHEILLKFAYATVPAPTFAQMHGAIDLIRLKLDAVTIREFTIAELEAILKSKGQPLTAGYIPIFFSEPWRVTRTEEEIFALVTQGRGTFTLEVIFKSTVTGPELSGTITYDFLNSNRFFMKWERATVPVSSVGDFDWNTISKVGALSALHLFTPDITEVQVTADNIEVLRRTKAQNKQLLAGHGYIQDDAVSIPLMFDYTGYNDDTLNLTKTVNGVIVPRDEFNVKLTKSSAGAFPCVIERAQLV
jgi:hypothetical protein